MGLIANTARSLGAVVNKAPSWQPVPTWQSGIAQPMALNYEAFAREGYGGNEIVFACVEEIRTSASEPRMMIRKGKEWAHDDRILTLMDRPNAFMDRYLFWSTILMHYHIAGNAYALKVRSRAGRVVELWLLRPDRVKIVPDAQKFIARYDYQIGGGEAIPLPANDVIHWKRGHPLNDFYGMSPLQVIASRIDTDNYMREFIKAYFLNAGVPGGILSVKQSLSEDAKTAIRERFRGTFAGPRGWHELLVLDNAEATFTATTAQMGQRGLVVPELDEINEARIAAVFGVPLSIIGARLGMSSSSYGNRKSDREGFWDETLSPLYKELAGPLNLALVPEFVGVDEIAFDLSDVRALQEDVDKVHTRVLKDVEGGLMAWEEGRLALGLPATPPTGYTMFVPTQIVQVPVEDMGEQPEPVPTKAPPREPVASRNGNTP